MSIDVDELAAAVVDQLNQTMFVIPNIVAEELKKYHGYQSRMPICGGPWAYHMETKIMVDGGVSFRLTDASGSVVIERPLSPARTASAVSRGDGDYTGSAQVTGGAAPSTPRAFFSPGSYETLLQDRDAKIYVLEKLVEEILDHLEPQPRELDIEQRDAWRTRLREILWPT